MSAVVPKVAYSRREAAQATGMSVSTIDRATRSGKLRAKRVGHLVRILADDLRAWLDEQPDY